MYLYYYECIPCSKSSRFLVPLNNYAIFLENNKNIKHNLICQKIYYISTVLCWCSSASYSAFYQPLSNTAILQMKHYSGWKYVWWYFSVSNIWWDYGQLDAAPNTWDSVVVCVLCGNQYALSVSLTSTYMFIYSRKILSPPKWKMHLQNGQNLLLNIQFTSNTITSSS